MNDKDCSGKVSVEEVMQILFLRYGRQLLDSVRPRRHSMSCAADSVLTPAPPRCMRSNWRRSLAQATPTAAHGTCP
jgi:hypothetical protein